MSNNQKFQNKQHKPPKTLTNLQAERVLNELRVPNHFTGRPQLPIRNYTMGAVMLDAGLRVGELVQLAHSDLWPTDKPADTLLVRSAIAKNHAERIVPLSIRIRKAIAEMDTLWWQHEPKHPYLYAFYHKDPGQPLTRRQVQRIIARAATLALGWTIHPHILRHTFASRLMRTTNIRVVQQLLGHKSVTSTQIYTHPNQQDLKDAIDSMEKGDNNDPTH